MSVQRREDHSAALFFKRTLAAQIHAVALLLICIGMASLLPKAAAAGPLHFWMCFIFLVSGALLFFTSCVYHFLHDGYRISLRLELFLEDLDHYCIYLFIAGTYSPILINAVQDPWQTNLLVAVWVIALLGMLYTRLKPQLFQVLQSRAVYTGLFLLMGWLFILRADEIYARLTPNQASLLAGGVAAYSVGVTCYVTRRPVLFSGVFGYHELWHLFVLLGAMLHYSCIHSFY